MKHISRSTVAYQFILCVAGLAILYFTPSLSIAQESCGSIFYKDKADEVIPVEDCDNPFKTTGDEFPVQFAVDGSFYSDGDIVMLQGDSTDNYFYTLEDSFSLLADAYRHVDQGYQYQSLEPEFLPEPPIEDQLVFLEEYFADDPDVAVYRSIFLTGGDESVTPEQFGVYSAFSFGPLAKFTTAVQQPALVPGTYTFVFTEQEICVSHTQPESLFARFRELLIPTAHALLCTGGSEIYAITLILEGPAPEPTGASSVLFLPGIQASRLYKERSQAGEDQLWEPQGNEDVRQLAMTTNGESVNTVYTRDVVEEITGAFFGKNIYKGFLGLLNGLQNDQVIAEYQPFAYDWRNSVYEVATEPVKYPDGETKLLLD